jgi:hypothetical protein
MPGLETEQGTGRSGSEEFHKYLGNSGRLFVLEPVSGIGESEQLGVCAIAQAFVSHLREKKGVALAPEDARGDADGAVEKLHATTEERAIPVDHAGERPWLRPRSAVLGEIFWRKCAGPAGAKERARAHVKVECGEDCLR